MYILYGGGYTRAHMTEMVLAEIGAPYEVRPVDTMKGENRSPEFLKVNPAGWVPVLMTPDGQVLCETPAINLYLAERHGPGSLAPTIGDPDRGPFLSTLFYLSGELEPALKRYFYPHRYGVRETDKNEIRKKSLDSVCVALGVIDQRIAGNGPYQLGGRFSLVDLVLSYWVSSIMHREAIVTYGAVHNCVNLVQDRPALKRLFADLDARTHAYAEIDERGDRMR